MKKIYTLEKYSLEQIRKKLKDAGVYIASLELLEELIISPRKTELESPCNIIAYTGRKKVFSLQKMGAYSYISYNVSMKFVGSIGRYCSIAGNCMMGAGEHPTDFLTTSPILYASGQFDLDPTFRQYWENNQEVIAEMQKVRNNQEKIKDRITIGNDVWIGEGAFIRRGVTIGDGAIIAARSFVNKDVPPYTIVGGMPAKTIRARFDKKTIERLKKLEWWNYDLGILTGVPTHDIKETVRILESKIDENTKKMEPLVFTLGQNRVIINTR